MAYEDENKDILASNEGLLLDQLFGTLGVNDGVFKSEFTSTQSSATDLPKHPEFTTISSSYDAYLFHPTTKTFIVDTEVRARISFACERHMCHIRLTFVNETHVTAEQKDNLAKWDDTPHVSFSPSHENGFTRKSKAGIAINYEAINSIEVRLLTGARSLTKRSDMSISQGAFPAVMQEVINTIGQNGSIPMVIDIHFDQTNLASERIFLGGDDWSGSLAQAFQQNRLSIICEGSASTMKAITDLTCIMEHQKQRGGCPLNIWHCVSLDSAPYSQNTIVLQPPGLNLLYYNYKPKYCMFSTKEYLTVYAIGMALEEASQRERFSSYEDRTHVLRLLSYREGEINRYAGILPAPDEDEARIPPGTKFRIHFDVHSLADEAWHAEVIDRIWYAPPDTICVDISRPRFIDEGQAVYDDREVKIVPDPPRGGKMSDVISKDDGQEVRVRILAPDVIFRRNLQAMSRLDEIKSKTIKDEPTFSQRMLALLPAKNLHLLPKIDVFEDIREEFPNVEKQMRLNEEQEQAVIAAKDAICGVQIVHGPPGTGKSYLIREYAKLFFQAKFLHPILVSSPTNRSVDSLAMGLSNDMSQLRRKAKPAEIDM